MLQIHVLATRQESIVSECLNSLTINNVKPKLIFNHGKSILQGRRVAYFETDDTHVSFVDDDDSLLVDYATLSDLCDTVPVFTNSEYRRDKEQIYLKDKKLLNPITDRAWSLELEKQKIFTPHQSIIYPTETARDLFLESERLIKLNNWSENDCDFVMRILTSTTIGWTYKNTLAYLWNLNSNNEYKKRNLKHYMGVRAYFNI